MKVDRLIKETINLREENIKISNVTLDKAWDKIEERISRKNDKFNWLYHGLSKITIKSLIIDCAAVSIVIITLIVIPLLADIWKKEILHKNPANSIDLSVDSNKMPEKQTDANQDLPKGVGDADNPTEDNQIISKQSEDISGTVNPGSTVNDKVMTILSGVWLKKSYTDNLMLLKSPAKALLKEGNGSSYVCMWAYSEAGEDFFSGTHNFHQGLGDKKITEVVLKSESSYTITLLDSYSNEKNSIILEVDKDFHSTGKITITDNGVSNSYVRVCGYKLLFQNEVSNFVNNIVLAGRYRDENGKEYVFTGNSTAKWPDKEIRYLVSVSTMFSNNMDHIVERVINQQGKEVGGKAYVFETIDDYLYLYEATQNETGIIKNSKPLAKLKKY